MNKQTLQAIAYVQNALSFVFLDFGIQDAINRIYLYGSAVRGELDKHSDIDVFIDCELGREKVIEAITKSAFSRFYQSKDFDKWKKYQFNYPFSVQAGRLMDWQLKTSIMSEGILLYSKKSEIVPGKREVLFTYQLPKKKKEYLHFTRALFGRKEQGYKDTGLLGEAQGVKINGNAFMIPRENLQKITRFMQGEKIDYAMKEINIFQ